MKYKTVIMFMVSFLTFAIVTSSYAEILTLSDGVRLAAENSRLVKISELDERISEADALIAKSPMLPSVNASVSQTYLSDQPGAIFGAQNVPTSEKDFLSYSLRIQQTLYDFRRNASRYEAGKMIVNTRKLDTVRSRNIAALDFITGYFDLLEAEKVLGVIQKEVEGLQSHLRNAESLYEEGVITKNDLLQADVRISDARQRLLTAGKVRAITASRLNNILARPLKTDFQVQDINGPSYNLSDLDIEKAWEAAGKQRAEIEIVNETLEVLDLEKETKTAEYYPEFFIRGGYDYTENPYQLHEGNWSVILGVNVNLFSGGITKAGLMKIEQQKYKLLEQKDKLIEEIKLEVEKYMLDSGTARERIVVTENAVAQAEENLRINRVRFEEGVGTATDVLDAVTLLTTAETNYYRAVYDLRKAEAGVIYSTGQDLSEVYK
ncbi:MAG: TolC family protein [Nitrospirae bacterium]|nr:TolC family protein [Nitrospirota bacterium]